MNLPRRRFLGSSLFMLSGALMEALATPLWQWRDPTLVQSRDVESRCVSGAVCGCGASRPGCMIPTCGVASTTNVPSSRPREADWLFSTTTMTAGWTSISPMAIGWMHIGRRERRRPLICTRTTAMVRLPMSPRNQDWRGLVGRPASASATTTMTDGTICFAASGGTTSSFTTMEMAPSPTLLGKPDCTRKEFAGAQAVLFSTTTGTATSIFLYATTSSWIRTRFHR